MHTHSWELIYSVLDRQVRHCTDIHCDSYESLVYNWNDHTTAWVAGNLWLHDEHIYICTGTFEEYQEVASKLNKAGAKDIIRLESTAQLETINIQDRASILLWGTWYEAPIIRDPAFAYLLNLQAG